MAIGGLWPVVPLVAKVMKVKIDPSSLRQTRWYEFAARFVFGGLITATAGFIAQHYGPGFGGLFLAFPAIFPASATLVEKHEEEKAENSERGKESGRKAVAADAEGSALGSLGLVVFAAFVWQLLPRYPAWLVLAGATALWLSVALVLWTIRATFFSKIRSEEHSEA